MNQDRLQYYRKQTSLEGIDMAKIYQEGFDDGCARPASTIAGEIFQEIENSFSATDYHSPEAGRDNVNSIDVREWERLKSRFGVK